MMTMLPLSCEACCGWPSDSLVMRIVEIDSGQVGALFPILLQAEPSERDLLVFRYALAGEEQL